MSREMKNSGIEWIGYIPEHWEVKRFKNFIELVNTPSCSLNKIALENIEGETGRFIPSESKFEGNGIQFSVDNIVYGKLRPYLQKVWLATFEGNAVGDFFVFKTQNGSIPKYVKWLMLSDGFTKMVDSSTYGAKMPRVASDFILNLPFYLPSVEEQSCIANFLDKKCAEIDKLISVQERMIEKLTTYKQSVITEAVTKGLNPNVSMEDSGIEWIGNIPEHWEVLPHKRVMHKVKIIQDKYNGEPILSLTMKGVVVRDLEAGGKMPASFDGYQKIYPGNLLQCLFDIDVTPRCVGLINNKGLTSPAYSQFELKSNASGPYYEYLLRYMDDEKCILHLSKNLRSSLTEFDFGLIPTILPPLSEQSLIADYLDKKCAEIDRMIEIKRKKIEKLNTYKKSIIFEYVTGKKEVPHA